MGERKTPLDMTVAAIEWMLGPAARAAGYPGARSYLNATAQWGRTVEELTEDLAKRAKENGDAEG